MKSDFLPARRDRAVDDPVRALSAMGNEVVLLAGEVAALVLVFTSSLDFGQNLFPDEAPVEAKIIRLNFHLKSATS